jgi:hypothetical protein
MPPFGTTTLGNWIRDASTREAAIVMVSAVGMTASSMVSPGSFSLH